MNDLIRRADAKQTLKIIVLVNVLLLAIIFIMPYVMDILNGLGIDTFLEFCVLLLALVVAAFIIHLCWVAFRPIYKSSKANNET